MAWLTPYVFKLVLKEVTWSLLLTTLSFTGYADPVLFFEAEIRLFHCWAFAAAAG